MRSKAARASAGPAAASPSCQASSPQRVRTSVPSGLMTGLPGEMRLPTRDDAVDPGQVGHFGGAHDVFDAGQLVRLRAGEEMVEGQHRVGLAAAEVGLELDDRLSAEAAEAFHPVCEEALEAVGRVGAAEELGRVAVFGDALAEVHLPEVGGELGLLVVAAGDVGVGAGDLAPGGQAAGGGGAFGGCGRRAPSLRAGLLLEADPQQLQLQLFDLGRFCRRDGGQEAVGGVEDAVGVVAGEGALVCPLVAEAAQLADKAAFGVSERHTEYIMPGLPHHPQQHGDVHVVERLVGVFAPAEDLLALLRPAESALQDLPRAFFVVGDELARDEGGQTESEDVQGEADAFSIGCGHRSLSCDRYVNSRRSQSTNAIGFSDTVSRGPALISTLPVPPKLATLANRRRSCECLAAGIRLRRRHARRGPRTARGLRHLR